MSLYKNVQEDNTFLVIDSTLAPQYLLSFRENLLERI